MFLFLLNICFLIVGLMLQHGCRTELRELVRELFVELFPVVPHFWLRTKFASTRAVVVNDRLLYTRGLFLKCVNAHYGKV